MTTAGPLRRPKGICRHERIPFELLLSYETAIDQLPSKYQPPIAIFPQLKLIGPVKGSGSTDGKKSTFSSKTNVDGGVDIHKCS